jgi:hypothetical protein
MQDLPAGLRARVRATTSLVAAGALIFGCTSEDDVAVWKQEVPSPDGRWIARAVTTENGGFGSGFISTTVRLQRREAHPPGIDVLEFDGGAVNHAYVLDNVANAGGGIHLTMKWTDNAHLQVRYDNHPDLNFQAVKLQDVTITTQDLSGPATASSR